MISRRLYVRIWERLSKEKSMVFLSGPRQVGKTTLARIISRTFRNRFYFNYDIPEHRKRLIENPSFFETMERKDPGTPLIIFDEIHKYRDWKNYLKGVYDAFHDSYRFLVSGSGRLDIYRKGGDSLAGRYFLFHLWPFTVAELGGKNRSFREFIKNPLYITMEGSSKLKKIWERLALLSGFPEPYASGKETTYNRWSNTYSQQLIREDIRDMTDIKSIGDLETLYLLLPSKIGSPLSVTSLAEDMKAAYNTVQNWLSVFERFFMLFAISPWAKRIARAVHKEKKVYLFDTPRIKDPAARFENMVAIELLRAVTLWNDAGYGRFSLHYIKNKEKQEVDFLIVREEKPFMLAEAKLAEKEPSFGLKKFQQMLNIPAVQLTNEGATFRVFSNGPNKILVAPAYQWLSSLP